MSSPSKLSKSKFVGLLLVSQLIPVGFAVFISMYLLQKTTFKFEYAFPLMILWSSLAAGIHYLSLKRGMTFRWSMTAVFGALTVATAFGLNHFFAIDHSNLKTCPVCGFVALPAAGQACPVCQVTFREADAASEGFDSPQDYLIAAQTMHFMPEAPDTSIDFFAPCNCSENYQRDPNWKPSVSKQDVLDVQAMTVGQ